ncbi:MAG: DUF5615 family PIN-like protein [Peptococcaceae bacterium]|nr:DUF5615 family PIN-like protein [Peptococcaceae bacterium]
MRFLLDECISPRTCSMLKSKGFDVAHIHPNDISSAVGGTDEQVFILAQKDNRIIITLNRKHFYSFDASKCGGIILVKVNPTTPAQVNLAIENCLDTYAPEDLNGKTLIITTTNVRVLK